MRADGALRVAVLGAGSWGSALAIQAARLGHEVGLWGRDAERLRRMRLSRVSERYLDGCALPPGLDPTPDRDQCLARASLVLVCVPSAAFAATLDALPADAPRIAWATKGLDPHSGHFLHEVFEARFPERSFGVLSGPSFAADVAAGLPTAVVAASRSMDIGSALHAAFHGGSFRVYSSRDVVGVELGGALKNVLAIAAGASDGAGFGANARAAIITRGLAEMQRLGAAVGADPATLVGLSGLGDLVLTCTDDQSRNRRLGLALGRGMSIDAAVQSIGQAIEGMGTVRTALRRAERLDVELPIMKEVAGVLEGRRGVVDAMRRLLEREPAAEF